MCVQRHGSQKRCAKITQACPSVRRKSGSPEVVRQTRRDILVYDFFTIASSGKRSRVDTTTPPGFSIVTANR